MSENWLQEAYRLVYGGGRDYNHPLIQHLNAGMRQAIRNKSEKWCDPISIAENSIYMKQSREDGGAKVDNHVDTVGYEACINRMCDLYIALGHVEEGDYKRALQELRNLSFGQMWNLYLEAIAYKNSTIEISTDSPLTMAYNPYNDKGRIED